MLSQILHQCRFQNKKNPANLMISLGKQSITVAVRICKSHIMNFTFSRNIHFTKLVKTSDRLREFNFRLLPGNDNLLFHVDVPDDRGNRVMFKMQKENERWRLVESNLPKWIVDNEQRLNDLIGEELSREAVS